MRPQLIEIGGFCMSSFAKTQALVAPYPHLFPQNGPVPEVLRPVEAWSCDLCVDPKTDEPFANSLTPETRRFVERRIAAAIAELKTRLMGVDPEHRHAVWLAITGLLEVIEELAL